MDALEQLVFILTYPLRYPVFGGERIYWLYLVWALVIAAGVYLVRQRRREPAGDGDRPRNLLSFWFPKRIYAHASALVDYKYFFVNRILFPAFLAPFVVGTAAVSAWTAGAIEAAVGPQTVPLPLGLTGTLLLTALAVLAMDAGIFIAHTLQHKVPLLWEFHKVHHSAEVLTPITVYRMHPVDDLLTGTVVGVLTGVVYGVFAYVCGHDAAPFTVLELNAVLFAFYVLGYNLRHSHIWLPYPAALSYILVSPAQHQIHHSKAPKHFDKNMGFIFAFWDYLAGTLYVPRAYERLDYGLDRDEHHEFDGVWRLYTLPFRKAAALLLTGRRERV